MSKALSTIPYVPKGQKIKTAADGTIYRTEKKMSGKRYKLSKKTRDAMSTARKRFKVPVLSIGANIIPIVQTVGAVKEVMDWGSNASMEFKAARIFNAAMSPYTGIKFNWTGAMDRNPTISWDWKELLKGGLPNVAVMLLRKSKVFKSINQKFAENRIPIRLS